MAGTEQVQGYVAYIRPSRQHKNIDVILVTFVLHGNDNSAEFHTPKGQHSIGEQFPIYVRNGKASLT